MLYFERHQRWTKGPSKAFYIFFKYYYLEVLDEDKHNEQETRGRVTRNLNLEAKRNHVGQLLKNIRH